MTEFLPRALYVIGMAACYMLVWPNPITLFLAACFSCLTVPIYRRFRKMGSLWRQKLEEELPDCRKRRILLKLVSKFPIVTYASFIIFSFITPFAILILLVSPQAVSGLAKLRELQAANFQLPPHWLEYLRSLRRVLAEYPNLEKAVSDTINNIDTLITDSVGMLVSRGFGVVGSTFNIFWLTFLFLMLTILLTRYSRNLRKITGRILRLPHAMLGRFILVIHKALKGIMLGIVLVALVQGTLCGIGFAFADVNQPAFWGLLATMVAPIPMVGTALVWGPLCIALWFSGKGMAAVCLCLWGAIFVSGVDNVLRPFFLKQGINAPFFVLILVILCGLSSFGAVGLIAGPVILAIAMQAMEEANRYYRR